MKKRITAYYFKCNATGGIIAFQYEGRADWAYTSNLKYEMFAAIAAVISTRYAYYDETTKTFFGDNQGLNAELFV